MSISLDEILLYTECPVKYMFRNSGIKKPEPIIVEFDRNIHKAVYSFYYSVMNKQVPTSELLKQRWGSLWSKKMSMGQIMFRKPDEHTDLELKGVSMLINFHRIASQNPTIPIAVEHEYCVEIGGYELTGVIELIRESISTGSSRVIEIVDFKTGEYIPDQFLTDHEISLTAQSYAFRKLFNAKEQRLVYYFLKNGKQYYTTRDEIEFNKLARLVDGVANNIAKGAYYPKYSYGCKRCDYQYECGRWKA